MEQMLMFSCSVKELRITVNQDVFFQSAHDVIWRNGLKLQSFCPGSYWGLCCTAQGLSEHFENKFDKTKVTSSKGFFKLFLQGYSILPGKCMEGVGMKNFLR